MRRRISTTYFLVFQCVLFFSIGLWAEVPENLRGWYNDAFNAYALENYSKTVTLIDSLLKLAPKSQEFSDLKNIAQGMVYFKENNLPQAKNYFRLAWRNPDHRAEANFYLGVISFREEKWTYAAAYFNRVISSKAEKLKSTAYYYLAQIALKKGDSKIAISDFVAAKDAAQIQLERDHTNSDLNSYARLVQHESLTALANLTSDRFFGSLSLYSGYDSNSIPFPNVGQAQPLPSTDYSTLKETIVGDIGFTTSPARTFQLTSTFENSFNYNVNAATREAQFLNYDLTNYITHGALKRFSYGVKIEGVYVEQDQPNYTTNGWGLQPFSWTESFGPFFKVSLSDKIYLGGQWYAQPENYFTDSSNNPLYQLSGLEQLGRLYLKVDKDSGLLNPGVTIVYDYNNTNGTEFRSNTITGEINNTSYLGGETVLSFNLDFGLATYNYRPEGFRVDQNYMAELYLTKNFGSHWSGLIDLQYINNLSNVPLLFQYSRFIGNLGITYNF